MNESLRQGRNRKLIVLGQTPPPLHGQAVAIKAMIDGLEDKIDILHVPMRFSETVLENGRFKVHKIIHLLHVTIKTLWLLIRYRDSVLYYPPAPASWVPVLRDLVILTFTRPFASKTVFHFHAHGIGGFLEDRTWLCWFSWALRRPDHAIILSRSSLEDVEKVSPMSVAVIPHGINIVPAKRSRPQSGKIVVLYVGMLAEEKGIFDLLDTAYQLKGRDIEFRLVGTSKDSDTLPLFEDKRTQLQLDKAVIYVGKRSGDDLWQEYADADIFFFPTHFETETFGIVVLEAMAHGLPVVASCWRGPKDIVLDGETGILCTARDTLAYARAIEELVENKELRDRMGCNGKALCSSRYSLSEYLASMEDVFSRAGVGSRDA